MVNFKRTNTIIGWVVFAISLLVYWLSVETTVSFWDCGEFISAAYKLQITHPPGAPLYQLLGRFFALFAFGNTSVVALSINMLSVVSSAFCVLLTYFITCRLAEKILNPLGVTLAIQQYYSIWGAGIIAAFTIAFSDTFWFSAVEAEVYSLSSLFTLLIIWAALKWEENKNSIYHTRWFILIAFTIGLSIGVHILNLLVIPAVVCFIYLSTYQFSFLNICKSLFLGVVIFLFIQFIIIPGIPYLAFIADRFTVNSFNWSDGYGAILFIVIALCFLIIALIISFKKRVVIIHTTLLCLAFILIGYSSYIIIPIRASASPTLNINRPDNAASFLSYIKREQYGSRSLIYGPAFNAPVTEFKKGNASWRLNKEGKYSITNYATDYTFNQKYLMLTPRMGNVFNENSIDGYTGWTGVNKKEPPSQLKNWEFFFKYQFLHMYVRYHLWNFAGKQNDFQGHGNAISGNSESGLPVLDNLIAAPNKGLPKSLENKGKNHYYFLPLLLGFIGLFFHAKKQKESFVSLLVLFLFTGVLLCFYLNVPPFEPRERDYVFVGSFHVFSIWVGVGAFWLSRFLRKWFPKGAWVGLTIAFLVSPFLLFSQNWDDHNRRNRSFAKDYALNFLKNLKPNAVLFVYGDNETYPLWYLQNVEGIRTDIRILNINLLGSRWGAFELLEQQNQSKPFKLTLSPFAYQQGKRNALRIKQTANPVLLKKALLFAANDSNTLELSSGKLRAILPTNQLILPFEKADTISISSTHIYRSDLIMLDIVANNPNRPMYFSSQCINKGVLFPPKYLQNEGLVFCLKKNSKGISSLPLIKAIKGWKINGFNNKRQFIDHEAKKVGKTYIKSFATAIEVLLDESKNKEAGDLAVQCAKTFPVKYTDFKSYKNTLTINKALYKANYEKKAINYSALFASRLMQETNYYASIKGTIANYSATKELKTSLVTLKKLKALLVENGQQEKAMEIEKFLAFFAVNKK